MFFRLLQGVECIPLEDDAVVLVSDWVRLKLEGRAAREFAQRAIPVLSQWTSLNDLVPIAPSLSTEDWLEQLQALKRAGVLQQADEPTPTGQDDRLVEDLIASLGQDGSAGRARWKSLRIAIFGLEHIGAQVARTLAPLEPRRLTLVDPFPSAVGIPLAQALQPEVTNDSRAAGLARELSSFECVADSSVASVSKVTVEEIAKRSDLLVGTFDRGFSAAHHWINRSAITNGVPAVFAQASGIEAVVGPWVFPGESACYMCWRMRTIAANSSFDKTIAYECAMDKRRQPAGASRPTLPGLVSTAAGHLCTEIFTTLLGLSVPSIANAVMRVDGLNRITERHGFLHRPDCPSCRGVHKVVRSGRLDDHAS